MAAVGAPPTASSAVSASACVLYLKKIVGWFFYSFSPFKTFLKNV